VTPAEVSRVDQALAEFADELDRLIWTQKQLAPRRGREQAAADICALLNTLPAHIVAATLSVAVLRLADAEGES